MLRNVRVLDSLKIVEDVTSRFGFSPISVTRLRFPHIFLVDIKDRSSTTERLFIKFSDKDESRQIELCRALQAAELIYTPTFKRSRDGEWCVRHDDKFWTCQSFVPTDVHYDWLSFDCSNIHCSKAGEALGSLHSKSNFIAEQLYSEGKALTVKALIESEPGRLSKSLAEVKAFFDPVGATPSDPGGSTLKSDSGDVGAPCVAHEIKASKDVPSDVIDAIQKVLSHSDKITARAAILCAELAAVEQKSALVVNHGDFHSSNIIFSPAGIKLVCDWEYACIGSPLYDLSYALYLFCFDFPSSPYDPPISAQRMEFFLDGYSRYARITGSKMRLLDKYMEYTQLVIMRWLLDEFVDPRSHVESLSAYWKFCACFLEQCSK